MASTCETTNNKEGTVVEKDKENIKTDDHSGIPRSDFIEDIPAAVKKESSVEALLSLLEQALNKYRLMEVVLNSKKDRLSQQVPDLKSALQIVGELKTKNLVSEDNKDAESLDVRFLLSDHVYSKARVGRTEKVLLWLGANVMLEYPLDEAKEVLEKSLKSAMTGSERTERDLAFVRDQSNTTQVNIARVYNWSVANSPSPAASAPQATEFAVAKN